ncbi:hypothetical protein LSAT2_009768 [Lamellibrachia satsuma]|nr:hypothetical protein LSAT2_009768 [Lamellibrachia satsuma]
MDDFRPLQGVARQAEQQDETAGAQDLAVCGQLWCPPRGQADQCEDGVPASKHDISPAAVRCRDHCCLKAHYRKRLMRHVLAGMDNARTATELTKRADMLDAISWLHLAWASISESTVMKCFAVCGFSSDTRDDVPEDEDALQPVGFACDELLGVVGQLRLHGR